MEQESTKIPPIGFLSPSTASELQNGSHEIPSFWYPSFGHPAPANNMSTSSATSSYRMSMPPVVVPTSEGLHTYSCNLPCANAFSDAPFLSDQPDYPVAQSSVSASTILTDRCGYSRDPPTHSSNEEAQHHCNDVTFPAYNYDTAISPNVSSFPAPNGKVATDNVIQASSRRRRTEARYICDMEECGQTFTTQHNLTSPIGAGGVEGPS
uniref:Uncharacterized protein n=1 Tax=Moniliophthora roreri TaxID=221103 RepID=A0A0W0FWG3_MONRR